MQLGTKFRSTLSKASICLALLLLTGCVNAPLQLDLKNTNKISKSNSVQPCEIIVGDLEDIRKDKKSIGTIGNHPITGIQLLDWIKTTLIEKKFLFAPDTTSNNAIRVDIRLKLLHMRTSESIMKTNLVLQIIDTTTKNKFHIRGADTKVIWFGSESEFKNSFSRALLNAIEKIQVGIKKDCTLEKVNILPKKAVEKSPL